MKKLFFPLLALSILFFTGSCASDSCSFKGKWKVKSAGIKSAKLSPSILSMAKEDLMATTYEFTKDGKIKIIPSAASERFMEGTWTFDEVKQEVQWSAGYGESRDLNETSQITNCTGKEVTLSQRMPADASKEELALVTFTLERVE